jgi:hypothetical protein
MDRHDRLGTYMTVDRIDVGDGLCGYRARYLEPLLG